MPLGKPLWLPIPTGGAWSNVILNIGAFTHSKQAPIEVRRFTTGSTADIGTGPGARVRADCEFEHQEKLVGLGEAFPADAIIIELKVPASLGTTSLTTTRKGRALRTARFFDRAWRGEALAQVSSPFMREWLAQVLLSALTYEAIQQQTDLQSASNALREGSASIGIQDVLTTLFESQIVEADDRKVTLDGDDRLRQELQALLSDNAILQELYASAAVLWMPPDPEWDSWLQTVYHSTMGAAVLRAIVDLCPTLDPDDLLVDLMCGASETVPQSGLPVHKVWISERAPGGNGHIEEFLRSYAEDPRRFFSTIRAALDIGEFEFIDQQLNRLLDVLLAQESPSAVRECVHRFRSSATHAEMAQASKEMRLALVREGFAVFHGFLTSVGTRLLRQGTGSATDSFVSKSIRRWNSEEERLGVEIDLRIIAYCLSQAGEIDEVAREAGIPSGYDLRSWRMSAIYGLLWPRGRHVRQSALHMRNPFKDLPNIERLLVIDTLHDERELVSVEDEAWFEQATAPLSAGKLVTLTCTETHGERLADALSFLITNPIDSGYLRTYARLQCFRKSGDELRVDIELAEAEQ
jgi:hypothetical protein